MILATVGTSDPGRRTGLGGNQFTTQRMFLEQSVSGVLCNCSTTPASGQAPGRQLTAIDPRISFPNRCLCPKEI